VGKPIKEARRRLGRGVYCRADKADDPWTVVSAWLAVLPGDSVLSGPTAAWLHGLDVNPSNPIEVIVPFGTWARSRASLRVRHCKLASSEIVRVRGRRATSIARTMRDLSRRVSRVEFLVLADAALRLDLGRFDELAEPAESPMETRLRLLLLQAGLPRPEVQTKLHDSHGRFVGRADLYYPAARLVIEYDGANHRDRLVEDNRRQNALLAAGFTILRYTASDIHQRPEAVVTQVRQALRASGTAPPAAAASG